VTVRYFCTSKSFEVRMLGNGGSSRDPGWSGGR
jgi:hypothetical protein